jgi:hypothetical protein
MSLRSILKRNREAKHGPLPASREATVVKALPIVATAAPAKPKATVPKEPCAHRGLTAIRSEECGGCRKKTQLKVFPCAVFGECTIAKPHAKARGCCKGCTSYVAEVPQPNLATSIGDTFGGNSG